jgi:hypothetical protein
MNDAATHNAATHNAATHNIVYTVGKYSIFNVTRRIALLYVSFCSTNCKRAAQTTGAMPLRPRVSIIQARKLVCPAEGNIYASRNVQF